MTNESTLLKGEREILHRGRYEGYAPCLISSVLIPLPSSLPLSLARPSTGTSRITLHQKAIPSPTLVFSYHYPVASVPPLDMHHT